MRIAVTGSVATDYLATFPGRFTDQLLPDQLSHVSLSFLVHDLEVRRGGTAANVSFGLGSLGLAPELVGAVGSDFAEYETWLMAHGVGTGHVRVSDRLGTARFMCTTDAAENQIATFYAGAMAESALVDLRQVHEATGGLDLVLVCAGDPTAMLRHTAQCQELGVAFAADPSQQLATLDRESVRRLVEGAGHLFTNAYEAALLTSVTGWTDDQVLDRVGTWITTRGADGVLVRSARHGRMAVPAVPVERVADPTGGGDAFRAGFLAGLAWRMQVPDAARLGCALAALALESVGPQQYTVHPGDLAARLTKTYGASTGRRLVGRPEIAPIA